MLKFRLKSKSGFTMIEMVVTAVVIGIVTALAMPHFDSAYERIKFRGQAKQLLSLMRTARSEAISSKSQYGIYIDGSNYTLTYFEDIANPSNFTYDDGSDSVITVDTLSSSFNYLYSTFSNSSLVFQPNGSAAESGNIYMMSNNGNNICYTHLTVLASTGRSRIEFIHNY